VAAHTAHARRAGLTEQQTKAARRATLGDEKEQAALVFARKTKLVVRVTPRATSSPDRTEHGLHRSDAHAGRGTYTLPDGKATRPPVLGELASEWGASTDYRDPHSVNYLDRSQT
jgi:hypothetical protein